MHPSSDTDTTLKTAKDNRANADPCQSRRTSAPKGVSADRKNGGTGSKSASAWRDSQDCKPEHVRSRSRLERLLLILHNFYVPADLEFPDTVRFVVDDLQTTVIFERVRSRERSGQTS